MITYGMQKETAASIDVATKQAVNSVKKLSEGRSGSSKAKRGGMANLRLTTTDNRNIRML